jgi:long-subunit acyl-CoA synthetase (AMP-forming)
MGDSAVGNLSAALSDSRRRGTALEDGERRVSYEELESLIAEERRWLVTSGGERFAVLGDNGTGWAITDLALHLGDMVSVPVPAYFTASQVWHVLDDAGVDAVLAEDNVAARDLLRGWRVVGVSGRTGFTLFRRALDPAQRPSLPPGTAKITYTSGSTGSPKGVCLSARQLELVAQSLAGATSSLEIRRHLCLLPLATLLENVAGILAPLLAGAHSILPATSRSGMSYAGVDPARLLGVVAASRPESLVLVPELLQLLVGAAERGWAVPDSMKFVAVGGASVAPELLERAAAAGLPVYEGYGLSECASVVCLNRPGARRPGSVGRPLPHASLRIDADGELCVSGATMLGYLGDSPIEPGAELRTGDVGEVDEDGYVYVRGRLRNVFITSYGRNVEPEWVEREFAQQPGIRHAMVFGEARPYPVALVSPLDQSLPAAVLQRAVLAANSRLPEYARVRRWAAVPGGFSFDNGLLTANGRLRRPAILERHGGLIDSLYRDEIAS